MHFVCSLLAQEMPLGLGATESSPSASLASMPGDGARHENEHPHRQHPDNRVASSSGTSSFPVPNRYKSISAFPFGAFRDPRAGRMLMNSSLNEASRSRLLRGAPFPALRLDVSQEREVLEALPNSVTGSSRMEHPRRCDLRAMPGGAWTRGRELVAQCGAVRSLRPSSLGRANASSPQCDSPLCTVLFRIGVVNLHGDSLLTVLGVERSVSHLPSAGTQLGGTAHCLPGGIRAAV
jgi:hypothetical protein